MVDSHPIPAKTQEKYHPDTIGEKLDRLLDYGHDLLDSLDQTVGCLTRIANALEDDKVTRVIVQEPEPQLTEDTLPWWGHGDP